MPAHRYDDMPEMPADQPMEPRADIKAWQDTHEPVLVVRAWVRADGGVMTNMTWAADVQTADVMAKPLEDMMVVMLTIAHRMQKMAEATAAALETKRLLEACSGERADS